MNKLHKTLLTSLVAISLASGGLTVARATATTPVRPSCTPAYVAKLKPSDAWSLLRLIVHRIPNHGDYLRVTARTSVQGHLMAESFSLSRAFPWMGR